MSLLNSFFAQPQTNMQGVSAIGIDLGTTNSLLAEARWDAIAKAPEIRCLEITQQTTSGAYTHMLLPSIVALHQGKTYIGQGAKMLRVHENLRLYKDIFYECKNLMGIQRTFNQAPKGYESAAVIASHILKYLADSCGNIGRRTVVTVPASFQIAQRRDTLQAAELAGIRLQDAELLDEPVAAFLDYACSDKGDDIDLPQNEEKTLLVFDFGGGTCDVAIFRLRRDAKSLAVKPLAVSRFHRLGGGDIDKAIIHQVLIPQLLEQNNLLSLDLPYDAKKYSLETGLLSIAETLKIDMCQLIKKLREFDRYEDADKEQLAAEISHIAAITVNNRELRLKNPKLTASKFEEIMEPFLDTEFLYLRETDYYAECSIFSPLADALERCGLEQDDIDYCLMVGGSSLIPQVDQAVTEYFNQAVMLRFDDYDAVQTCVARGAAVQALSLELYGHGLVRTVVSEDIFINTSEGAQRIIPQGHDLPYPSDGDFASYDKLVIPESSRINPKPLRIELLAGEEKRIIQSYSWPLTMPSQKGEELTLLYRMDQNQVLNVFLKRSRSGASEVFDCVINNPLVAVVNAAEARIRVEELEEKLRCNEIVKSQIVSTLVELGQLYTELGNKEKALAMYDKALKFNNAPNANILNRQAGLYGSLGDKRREEQYYLRAATDGKWPGAWFNLALAYRRNGKLRDAIESVDKAIAAEMDPPYLVLKAELESAAGRAEEVPSIMAVAWEMFADVEHLNEWELTWYIAGAKLMKDKERLLSAEQAKKSQTSSGSKTCVAEGQLPGLRN